MGDLFNFDIHSSVTFTIDVLLCGIEYRRYYISEIVIHDGLGGHAFN